MVFSLAPRSFSPGTPVSPLLIKQHFQIPIQPGIRSTKSHLVDMLPLNRYLFIHIKFYARIAVVTDSCENALEKTVPALEKTSLS